MLYEFKKDVNTTIDVKNIYYTYIFVLEVDIILRLTFRSNSWYDVLKKIKDYLYSISLLSIFFYKMVWEVKEYKKTSSQCNG